MAQLPPKLKNRNRKKLEKIPSPCRPWIRIWLIIWLLFPNPVYYTLQWHWLLENCPESPLCNRQSSIP